MRAGTTPGTTPGATRATVSSWVKTMPRERGLVPIERQGEDERVLAERFRQFPELRSVTFGVPDSAEAQSPLENDGGRQLD